MLKFYKWEVIYFTVVGSNIDAVKITLRHDLDETVFTAAELIVRLGPHGM